MANSIILKDKLAYFLITGASRGIGKTMAIETSRNFRAGSVVVLLARNQSGLEDTRDKILTANPSLKVIVRSLDLSKPSIEDCDSIAVDTLANSGPFELAMLVHNAGTLGDITKWSTDCESYDQFQQHFEMNVFGTAILNNRLLKALPTETKKLIVNITSKAAICPYQSYTFYCMSKAAREMYFRCLAVEFPDLLVLNYSPGPVETDMIADVQKKSVSMEMSRMVKEIREQGAMLTTDMTVGRFLEVIEAGNYRSGGHVDYYDDIDGCEATEDKIQTYNGQ